VAKRGSFFDTHYARGFGLNHGSPYLFDRTVPLLVRAPGIVPAGGYVRKPIRFDAYARTAAALLGVPPPSAAVSGADLTRLAGAPTAPAAAPAAAPATSQRSAER
jgi:arylsulfatase A-like enzyme